MLSFAPNLGDILKLIFLSLLSQNKIGLRLGPSKRLTHRHANPGSTLYPTGRQHLDGTVIVSKHSVNVTL